MTDLMASMERRIELAVAEKDELVRTSRAEAAQLALWGRRLEAELEAARKQLVDGVHELSRLSP
jgi:hypothetical protein